VIHDPVLKTAIVAQLLEIQNQRNDKDPFVFLDCTLGAGGHLKAVLDFFSASGKKVKALAFDQDEDAVDFVAQKFKSEIENGELKILLGRFGELIEGIQDESIDLLIADLGYSSDQLLNQKRGMSFQVDAPLDMRLSASLDESAADILLNRSREEISEILKTNSDERFADRIAESICNEREMGRPVMTTKELVGVVVRALPARFRKGRRHVATKTFQALRIAVNKEFEQLNSLLSESIIKLSPGGRLAVISFHSIEDRIIKRQFKALESKDGSRIRILTKKPIVASKNEIKKNPRARSAKLRVVERIE